MLTDCVEVISVCRATINQTIFYSTITKNYIYSAYTSDTLIILIQNLYVFLETIEAEKKTKVQNMQTKHRVVSYIRLTQSEYSLWTDDALISRGKDYRTAIFIWYMCCEPWTAKPTVNSAIPLVYHYLPELTDYNINWYQYIKITHYNHQKAYIHIT